MKEKTVTSTLLQQGPMPLSQALIIWGKTMSTIEAFRETLELFPNQSTSFKDSHEFNQKLEKELRALCLEALHVGPPCQKLHKYDEDAADRG